MTFQLQICYRLYTRDVSDTQSFPTQVWIPTAPHWNWTNIRYSGLMALNGKSSINMTEYSIIHSANVIDEGNLGIITYSPDHNIEFMVRKYGTNLWLRNICLNELLWLSRLYSTYILLSHMDDILLWHTVCSRDGNIIYSIYTLNSVQRFWSIWCKEFNFGLRSNHCTIEKNSLFI